MDSNPKSSNLQSMGASFSSSTHPQTLDPKPDPPSSAPNSPAIEESRPADGESGGVPTERVEGVEGGGEGEEEEEEEEGECGFCLYMKAGGCRDPFVAWEECIQDAENDGGDVAERCFEVTSMLKKCMDAHADYYEPILSAEKAMADSITEDAANDKSPEDVKKESDAGEATEEVEVKNDSDADEATVEVEVKNDSDAEEAKVEVTTIKESEG